MQTHYFYFTGTEANLDNLDAYRITIDGVVFDQSVQKVGASDTFIELLTSLRDVILSNRPSTLVDARVGYDGTLRKDILILDFNTDVVVDANIIDTNGDGDDPVLVFSTGQPDIVYFKRLILQGRDVDVAANNTLDYNVIINSTSYTVTIGEDATQAGGIGVVNTLEEIVQVFVYKINQAAVGITAVNDGPAGQFSLTSATDFTLLARDPGINFLRWAETYRIQLGPDPFDFIDVTDAIAADRAPFYTSNIVIISGLDEPAQLEFFGAQPALSEISIDGGEFRNFYDSVGNINTLIDLPIVDNGTTIQLRGFYGQLRINDVIEDWGVSYLPIIGPDPFMFEHMIDVPPNTTVTSNIVTLSGLNQRVNLTLFTSRAEPTSSISINGGEFVSYLDYTSTVVDNGTTIQLRIDTRELGFNENIAVNVGTASIWWFINTTPNSVPIVVDPIGDQYYELNNPVHIDISDIFQDPDMLELTYTASNLPEGLFLSNGIIVGTFLGTSLVDSSTSVTITAIDPSGGRTSYSFNMVLDVNRATVREHTEEIQALKDITDRLPAAFTFYAEQINSLTVQLNQLGSQVRELRKNSK